MLRRRRTLSVYATSAPIGSVFFESSSTADCARARASATVRLQDRDCVCVDMEDMAFDVRVMVMSGLEEKGERTGQTGKGWGREEERREKETLCLPLSACASLRSHRSGRVACGGGRYITVHAGGRLRKRTRRVVLMWESFFGDRFRSGMIPALLKLKKREKINRRVCDQHCALLGG
jgi:hypothetical protein